MFRHIHIVSCSPRSGTTLLHEAMVTCFHVDKHYDHEIRFNLVSGKDGELVISKRPKDIMYMADVLDDPELYVIYILRDPRDVIVSRHGKNRELYYSNIRLWREIHSYAKRLSGHKRFLEVRYEDFVTDPDAVQAAIAEKFPWLIKIHDFSQYHKHAQVSEKSRLAMHSVRPIAPTSIGVWKQHLPRIQGQQDLHGSLTPDLVACGYERSSDWEHVLDNVQPDVSRSLYAEKVNFWTRLFQRISAKNKVRMYRRKRQN